MTDSCIFDLDGVLVDTATYHFRSWKKLAAKLDFTIEDTLEEKLKGVSRMDSVNIVLEAGGIEADAEEKAEYARMKNQWYLDSIQDMGPEEILPGVLDFLEDLRSKDIKMAVGSASKNAKTIISKIGIGHFFEIIVDGLMVSRTKPDPEVFLLAAKHLGSKPSNCIVFEDSFKGIEAANEGGFYSVGVGLKENLPNAQIVIPGFESVRFTELLDRLSVNTAS